MHEYRLARDRRGSWMRRRVRSACRPASTRWRQISFADVARAPAGAVGVTKGVKIEAAKCPERARRDSLVSENRSPSSVRMGRGGWSAGAVVRAGDDRYARRAQTVSWSAAFFQLLHTRPQRSSARAAPRLVKNSPCSTRAVRTRSATKSLVAASATPSRWPRRVRILAAKSELYEMINRVLLAPGRLCGKALGTVLGIS